MNPAIELLENQIKSETEDYDAISKNCQSLSANLHAQHEHLSAKKKRLDEFKESLQHLINLKKINPQPTGQAALPQIRVQVVPMSALLG